MIHRNAFGKLILISLSIFIWILPGCLPGPAALVFNLPMASSGELASPTTTPEAVAAVSETPQPVSTPETRLISLNLAAAPVSGAQGFPDGINPLTGLQAPYPELLERRPVMIKVSNYPPSVRPQSGLSFADLVFEYYIGEGTNRFLATYYSQDAPQVGSLRSGRLIDAELARMYGAFLVYGSADVRVDKVLNAELGDRAVSNLEVPCPVVCGGDTHRAPWVYANSGELTNYIKTKGYDNKRPYLNGMVFNPNPPKSDKNGINIGVQYMACNRGEWRYDNASGQYKRWIEKWDKSQECKPYPMEPLTDYLTKDQLSFSNVVILFTDYYEYNPTLHDVFIWDKQASQRAVFYRDGLMYDGSWQAVSHDQPMQFFDPYGLPMALKPGNTWIIIADKHSSFKEIDNGLWEMYFKLS
jgi:hypothetical protein